MNALRKAGELLAHLVKREAPAETRESEWKTPALHLTPDQIMAALEVERADPKRQRELEHYRETYREGGL